MADESPAEGISLKYSKNIFVVHVILYAPKTNFFQHTQFVSNCNPCEIYISLLFLYTSAT